MSWTSWITGIRPAVSSSASTVNSSGRLCEWITSGAKCSRISGNLAAGVVPSGHQPANSSSPARRAATASARDRRSRSSISGARRASPTAYFSARMQGCCWRKRTRISRLVSASVFAGLPTADGIGLDVARDHAARSDHASVADLHAGQDKRCHADPAVAPDPHRWLVAPALLGHRALGILHVVVRRVDHRVRAEVGAVPDDQPAVAVDEAADVEADTVAQLDPVAVEPDDRVEVDTLPPIRLASRSRKGITRLLESVIITSHVRYRSRRTNAATAAAPTAARYASDQSQSPAPPDSAPPNGPRSIASRVKPTVSAVSSASASLVERLERQRPGGELGDVVEAVGVDPLRDLAQQPGGQAGAEQHEDGDPVGRRGERDRARERQRAR